MQVLVVPWIPFLNMNQIFSIRKIDTNRQKCFNNIDKKIEALEKKKSWLLGETWLN